MRKQWFTRALACALVLIMVLSLAACGGGSTPKDDDKTPDQTDKTPGDSNDKDKDKEGAEDLDFVTMDWYIGLTKASPDDAMINDAVNDYLKEKVNANVNMHFWTVEEWETKMPTMLSAGQDVGIIGFGTHAKLNYVVQSQRGSFYPLNDLLDEYGEGTQALFPSEVWDAMKIDGNIYGIPSLKDNAYIMSVVYNADMAEALDINMDEVEYKNWRNIEPFLEEVLEKRSEKFPEYDEYPLAGGAFTEVPYNFALETFLSDSYVAVANIDPFNDVEGYDNDTVFNLYATDEYREFAKSRQRMVKKNIFAYEHESEWNYTGGMFAWPGWGYTYMQEHLYGDAFTTKMIVSENIWTDTNNYFSAGTAISANASEPERAMMILNLINTDPEFATMMRFGIEDKHYIIDDEGKMTFEGSERNSGDPADRGYYHWYGASLGNLTIVNAPEDLVGPDGIMLTEMQKYNEEAVIPSHMGFVLDTGPITNEIAACTNVVMEYRDIIRKGQLETEAELDQQIDEFNEKLKANGVEKIVTETQAQIDAWKAAQ